MDTIKIPIIIKKRLSKSADITLPHMFNDNDVPINMGSVTDNSSTNNSIIGSNPTQTQLTDISSQLSEKKKIKIIKKPVITTKKIKKIIWLTIYQ